MTITKYEQSGFILQTDTGYRIAFDIASLTPIASLTGVTVDAVFSSHIHGDHFSLPQIKQLNPKTVFLNRECREALGEETLPFELVESKAGDRIEIGGVTVQLFNVDHGPNVSAPILENFGFLITADGKTIYFAGDMFIPSGIDVANLSVDYAMLPISGFYTFGPNEAFAFAKNFKHIGKLIPMHYTIKPETLPEFLALTQGAFDTETGH